MIIHRVVSLAACVAAALLLVVGCSASTTSTPTLSLGEPVAGHDEWLYWSSGKVAPEFESVGAQLGLAEVDLPTATAAKHGFTAVAKIGSSCLVAFTNTGVTDTGNMSAAIFPRYTPTGDAVVVANVPIDGMLAFMANYDSVCSPPAPSAPVTTT